MPLNRFYSTISLIPIFVFWGCSGIVIERSEVIEIEPISIEVGLDLQEPDLIKDTTLSGSKNGFNKSLTAVFESGTIIGDLSIGAAQFFKVHRRWPVDLDEVVSGLKSLNLPSSSFEKIAMVSFHNNTEDEFNAQYVDNEGVSGRTCIRLSNGSKASK